MRMIIAIIFVISLVALAVTAAHATKPSDNNTYQKSVALSCSVNDKAFSKEEGCH